MGHKISLLYISCILLFNGISNHKTLIKQMCPRWLDDACWRGTLLQGEPETKIAFLPCGKTLFTLEGSTTQENRMFLFGCSWYSKDFCCCKVPKGVHLELFFLANFDLWVYLTQSPCHLKCHVSWNIKKV